MEETKDDTKKWKDISCYWTGRINIDKNCHSTKTMYRFNATSIKTPIMFFTGLVQIILKFTWNDKELKLPKQP